MNRLTYGIISGVMLLTGLVLGLLKLLGRDNGAVNGYTLFIFIFFGLLGFAARYYMGKLDK
ncbi:MAG: hypothetical protein RLZZ628_940 [Bacteroidota bacterium]|jgi:hypothetical protein